MFEANSSYSQTVVNFRGCLAWAAHVGKGSGWSMGHAPSTCVASKRCVPSFNSIVLLFLSRMLPWFLPASPAGLMAPTKRGLSGTHKASFSSQLGHSQPQRPTVGKHDLSLLVCSNGSKTSELLQERTVLLAPGTAASLSAVHSNVVNCFFSRSVKKVKQSETNHRVQID